MKFLVSVSDARGYRVETQFALVLLDDDSFTELLHRRERFNRTVRESNDAPYWMTYKKGVLLYLTEDPDTRLIDVLTPPQRAVLKTYGALYVDDRFPANEYLPAQELFDEELHVSESYVFWTAVYNGQYRRTKRVLFAFLENVHKALGLNALMGRAMHECYETHGGELSGDLRAQIKLHYEMLLNTAWMNGAVEEEFLRTAYEALGHASTEMGDHALWNEGGQGFVARKAMMKALGQKITYRAARSL